MSNKQTKEIVLTYFELGTISDLVLGCKSINHVVAIGTFSELFESSILDFNKEIKEATEKFQENVSTLRLEFYDESNDDKGNPVSVIKEGKVAEDFTKEFEKLNRKYSEDMQRIKGMVTSKEVDVHILLDMIRAVLDGVELQNIKASMQQGGYDQYLSVMFMIGKKLIKLREDIQRDLPEIPMNVPEISIKEGSLSDEEIKNLQNENSIQENKGDM